jgi:hypothetical protein
MANLITTEWGFYGRAVEIEEIRKIISSKRWFFCSISGRRRIGKTTLIREALQTKEDRPIFYFLVPDSDERGVIQAFWDAFDILGLDTIEENNPSFPKTRELIQTFSDVAKMIRYLCEQGTIVAIDEFQYFHRKQLSPFTSFLQGHVDDLRETKSGGLFVLGSIHTEMTAILDDRNSPIFNRVTRRISVDHWDFETLFKMFDDQGVTAPELRLFFWAMFEGVPKFYRDCFDLGIFELSEDIRRETLRRLFFEGSSPLKDEAANWFLHELRGRYDTVLKLLAYRGTCSSGELRAEFAKAGPSTDNKLTAYLSTLIDRYGMVERLLPTFATSRQRKARYTIADNFLTAWLGAIARNVDAARIQPIKGPLERADKSLATLEGIIFEKMIRQLIEESSRKGVGDFLLSDFVRGYWNKPDGSDIEIDIVAYNEDDKIVRFGSCKRNQSKHAANELVNFEEHLSKFAKTKDGARFKDWAIQKALYSPRFDDDRREQLTTQGYLCYDLNDFARYLAN